MTKSKKIWGILDNIFLISKCKVDVLYLDKDTGCSIHFHEKKKNRFYLISGSVKLKTDLGEKILEQYDTFDIYPSITHQFIALEDSILIEIAFVDKGKLKEEDIKRKIQGGKFIKEKFYTLNELKDNNWKGYKNYE